MEQKKFDKKTYWQMKHQKKNAKKKKKKTH